MKRPRALEQDNAYPDSGPTLADKVCILRGKDVQRIVKQELREDVSLMTVYRTLQRLDDLCLAPRPRDEKPDLEAKRQFREVTTPLLSAAGRSGSRRLADAFLLRNLSMDESRVAAARDTSFYPEPD